MITCSPGQERVILSSILSDAPLTSEQLAALALVLASPECESLADREAVEWLHDTNKASVAVRRDADWPTTADWLREYQRGMLTGRSDLSAGIKQKWTIKIPALMAAYGDGYRYNARTATTFAAIAADAIADGVVTEEEVESFRARWEAQALCSPVSRLFGEGVVVTLADVAAARAL